MSLRTFLKKTSIVSSLALMMALAVTTNAEERILSETSEIDGKAEGLNEVQISRSMSLSQFVKPFSGKVYNVMSNETIKQLMPELYTEDGKIPEIKHSKLLKEDNGTYKQAILKDLFDYSNAKTPKKFFIEFEYDVEIEFEFDAKEKDPKTGKEVDVVKQDKRTETKVEYKEVYYQNEYSYFYLSLFAGSDTDMAERIQKNKDVPLSIDMYGNIVLDSEASKDKVTNRLLVIPNIANPALFSSDQFYIPTRKFLSAYQTDLYGLKGSNSMSEKSLKKSVGDKLGGTEVGFYDLNSEFIKNNWGYILPTGAKNTPYLYPDYNIVKSASKYNNTMVTPNTVLSADYISKVMASSTGSTTTCGDLSLFIFGDDYENTFANRFQTDGYQGDIGAIARTGVGKKNSSMAMLPTNRLYLGEAFAKKSLIVESKSLMGSTSSANLDYYDLTIYTSFEDTIIDNRATWDSKEISARDVSIILELTDSFSSGFKPDIYEASVDFSKQSSSDSGDPGEDIITKPEDVYEGKVNRIVNSMDYLFTHMGSGSAAIRTSNISKEYTNINSKTDQNYLFHMATVYGDSTLNKLMNDYIKYLVLINSAIFLIGYMMLLGKGVGDLIGYAKTMVFCVGLSTLPVIILSGFISISNVITENVFNDSFLYWTALDLDVKNKASDEEAGFEKKLDNWFREYNVYNTDSGSKVALYTGNTSERSFMQSITLLAGDVKRDTGATIKDIYSNEDRYFQSVFFYFYDTFRWHLYNYYQDEIDGGSFKGWEDERGLVQTKAKLTDMFKDPVFLYGQSFIDGFEDGEFDGRTLQAQDILGLCALFTKNDSQDMTSFNSYVNFTNWYRSITDHSKLNNRVGKKDLFDSDCYPDGIIYGSVQDIKASGRERVSVLEEQLDRLNTKVALELQQLSDYNEYTDETMLVTSALMATYEFNKAFNKNQPADFKLFPTSIESTSLSMDSVYKGIYLEDIETLGLYNGDVMSAVESKGGFIAQCLIFVSSVAIQICSFVTYLSVMCVFLFSFWVFVYSYNFSRNRFSKAWVGLLFFAGACLFVHFLFLVVVNLSCVPSTAIIRKSWLGGYSGITKNLVLFIAVLIKTVVIALLVKFAFGNPSDLGGAIISDKAAVYFEKVKSNFNNDGNVTSTSDSVQLEANDVELSDGDTTLDGEGTFELKGDMVVDGDILAGGSGGVELFTDSEVESYSEYATSSSANGSTSVSSVASYDKDQMSLGYSDGSVITGAGATVMDSTEMESGSDNYNEQNVSNQEIHSTTNQSETNQQASNSIESSLIDSANESINTAVSGDSSNTATSTSATDSNGSSVQNSLTGDTVSKHTSDLKEVVGSVMSGVLDSAVDGVENIVNVVNNDNGIDVDITTGEKAYTSGGGTSFFDSSEQVISKAKESTKTSSSSSGISAAMVELVDLLGGGK